MSRASSDLSPGPGDASPDAAELVAAAVRGVPGVADLHSSAAAEVATYLPGRRVHGVRLTESACEVHVAITQESRVADVAAGIRTAVKSLSALPVDVYVTDVRPQSEPDARQTSGDSQ